MKNGIISFRYKSEKSFNHINIVGESITVRDLKNKIKEKIHEKGTSKQKDRIDLLIYDEQTNEEIKDENAKIPTDKRVILERVPVTLTTTQPPPRRFEHRAQDKNDLMCKLCKKMLNTPILSNCCQESCCKTCYEESTKANDGKCPFCKTPSPKTVPNRRILQQLEKTPQVGFMTQSGNIDNMTSQTNMNPSTATVDPNCNKDIEPFLQEARYFIIKSANFDNLKLSFQHSEWATTKANEEKLNSVYKSCKNVILIFSVNKSSMYQGFCRMESPVTNKLAQFWKNLEGIRLGGCFKVRWLRKSDLPFQTMPNYRNSLNNNEPIRKSRDTQEIPGDIGREICMLFKVYELSVGSISQTTALINTPNYPTTMGQSSLVESPASDKHPDTPQQKSSSVQVEEQKKDTMEVETKKDNQIIDLYDIDLDPVYDEPETTTGGANANTGNTMEQEGAADNKTTHGGAPSDIMMHIQKDASKTEAMGAPNLANGSVVESKPVTIHPPPSIRTEMSQTTQPTVTSPKEERKVPELPTLNKDASTEGHLGPVPSKPVGFKPAPPNVRGPGPHHPYPGYMPSTYQPYQPGYPTPHHPGMMPHPGYSHPPMPYSNPYQPPGPHHYPPYPSYNPYGMGMHPGPYPYGPGAMHPRYPVGGPGQPMPGGQPTGPMPSTTGATTGATMKPEDAEKESKKSKRDKSKDGSDDEDERKSRKSKKDKEKDKDGKKKKKKSRSRSKSKKKHQ